MLWCTLFNTIVLASMMFIIPVKSSNTLVYSYKSLNPQIKTRLLTIVIGEYEDDLMQYLTYLSREPSRV